MTPFDQMMETKSNIEVKPEGVGVLLPQNQGTSANPVKIKYFGCLYSFKKMVTPSRPQFFPVCLDAC